LPGYKNRLIPLEFPELSEDGDLISVTLRNPQTVPFDNLQPRQVAHDANGEPIDKQDAYLAMYEVYARMIVNWHVYDATSLDDDQPELPLPATAENFAKLPLEVQNRVADEVNMRRNPTRTPSTSNS
jgi:hypothetical protein